MRIRIEFLSGVVGIAEPLSLFTIDALSDQAAALYPDVDEKPFLEDVANAAYPQKRVNPDNAEYKQLVADVERKRQDYKKVKVYSLALVEFENETHESLIARFHPRLMQIAEEVEVGDDEWAATLLHCILTGQQAAVQLQRIALYNQPLSQEEIATGRERFRIEV